MAVVAHSTAGIYLMHGTTSESSTTWAKLVDIVDFPDLFTEPEQLDATTLSNLKYKSYINGLIDVGNLSFTCHRTAANITALDAVADTDGESFAVWFGEDDGVPDGHLGKYAWTGRLVHGPNGGGANEVLEEGISISVDGDFDITAPTA